MCGLVAVVNDGLILAKLRDFVEQSLIANTLRGTDSSGLFAVNDKGECLYYKKTLPGWDFVQLTPTMEVLGYDHPRFIVGHNRAATRGLSSKLDHAHPVLHENIVLVHNGTLTSTFDLNKGLSAKESSYHDSTAIAMSIYRRGPIETLEMLEGAYALIWYNTLDHTLNFARNSERPLYMAQAEKGNGWLVASEGGMIKWLADRNGITIKQVALLKEGLCMTVPLNPKEGVSRRKFKIYESRSYRTQGGYHNNNSDYARQWWNHGYSPTKKGDIFRAIYTGSHVDGKTGKTVFRFKRTTDSAWGWYMYQDPSRPLLVKDGETYNLKALDDRVSGDTRDKLATITSEEVNVQTPPFSTTRTTDGIPISSSLPGGTAVNLYQRGDEVEFMVMDILPSRKGGNSKYNIKGYTIDEANTEVRIFNVDSKDIKMSIENMYKGKVSATVYRPDTRTGGEPEDYLILDRNTIVTSFLENQECQWCNESLASTGGQEVPELGDGAALCPSCLKVYTGYDKE